MSECTVSSTNVAPNRAIVAKFRHHDSLELVGIGSILKRHLYILSEVPIRIIVSWLNTAKHLRIIVRKSWPKVSASV